VSFEDSEGSWYESEKERDMADAYRRWNSYGSRQWTVDLNDGEWITVMAERAEILPSGALQFYLRRHRLVSEGETEYLGHEEMFAAFAAGQWRNLSQLSAMSGDRMCVTAHSKWWKKSAPLPQISLEAPRPPSMKERRAVHPERARMSIKLRFSILRRDGFACRACGRSKEQPGVKLHVDHIVAIANGGKTEESNLQTLCEECNLGKGAS